MIQIKIAVFLIGVLLSGSSGFPADINDEVEAVKPVKTYGDQPIIDTGIYSGWNNPFGSVFGNLDNIMERMRQQIAALLNRFPGISDGNATDEDISPFGDGFGRPLFPVLSGIDLSKGNTTSITKVIDGHTVVINETEYKSEDNLGGSFFKVRVIDVKPDGIATTTENEAFSSTEVHPEKDREELGNSMENEIVKSKEAELNSEEMKNEGLFTNNESYENLETFDEEILPEGNNENASSASTEWEQEKNSTIINNDWSNVESVDTVDSNSISKEEFNEKEYGHDHQRPFDLTRDTFVNEISAMNGVPIDKDAEVFLVENFDDRR